jgi:hypothetical protein
MIFIDLVNASFTIHAAVDIRINIVTEGYQVVGRLITIFAP